MTYANFWKRAAAYLVDGFIYGMAAGFIGQFVGLFMGLFAGIHAKEPSWQYIVTLVAVSLVVHIICFLLYFVWPECTSWQATIGKKIFGLKVTDLNGQRIGFGRSLGRNLGMIISSLILCIGYLMCFWTEKKQCLHDQLAGCLVLDETPQEKQGCAIVAVIVLAVVPILFLILGIVAAIAIPGVVRAQERAHMAEAGVLLNKVQQEQQKFLRANQHYATGNWHQFGMPILEDDTFCLTPDQECSSRHKFQVSLQEESVRALRINTTNPYELTLSYTPGGKMVCRSEKNACKQMGL